MTKTKTTQMIFSHAASVERPYFEAINEKYRCDERSHLRSLLQQLELTREDRSKILTQARQLAAQTRQRQQRQQGSDAFLQEYDLTSEEGVLLMCLAEALLRIPDSATQEALIANKLSQGQWDTHLGQSHSLLVNASTWGLLLTGQMVNLAQATSTSPMRGLQKLVGRLGEKVTRVALKRAMSYLAQQFVMGAHIEQALDRCKDAPSHVRYSFDCLGEAACCQQDVEDYFQAYAHAIETLASQVDKYHKPLARPSISVKLSALHPRYEVAQQARVMQELVPRLRQLAISAKQAGISLTIDAEEASRLNLCLDIFTEIYRDPQLNGWDGFGLAIQAYQKRALATLQYLSKLHDSVQRRIPIRLVKGAYWDSEIKLAQERGLDGYPVFTRKLATDVSYLCCAQFLLDHPQQFYAQFATHNAYTITYLLAQADAAHEFELQRLHGMGEALYESLNEQQGHVIPCRIYAPIGSHEKLLPYLVRRLLENGANTSFVNQLADEDARIEDIITDPIDELQRLDCTPHPHIPLPVDCYAPARRNAMGLDLSDPAQLQTLDGQIQTALETRPTATPLLAEVNATGTARPITNPAQAQQAIGTVLETGAEMVTQAFTLAADGFAEWQLTPVQTRAQVLERCADLMEHHLAELMALIIREGGRTIPDALAEVREAVDACRYYAQQGRHLFASPVLLDGPTGEQNTLSLHGRGVFVCISPWNFPVAIFTAQVAAALMAGNSVIAKPARATPLSAFRVIQLMHKAGLPKAALHFLPGSAGQLSKALLSHPQLAGVAFTGSTETAWTIHRQLAAREGPILPLIAETGGINAMIVDSSALAEQVVKDVLNSAFNSAGQRCSALRLLFVQQDIAEHLLGLLGAAMDELQLGDPLSLSTDIGPLIDAESKQKVLQHIEKMKTAGHLLKALELPAGLQHGHFVAPHLFEIEHAGLLEEEVFGPVLHVIRYKADELDQVIDDINATGYGLTLGVHSRIESTWQRVQQRARVGNLYINRNIIGAVMGVQPFGGEGLSGTGFKAGGPHYLLRFATERTTTINTAAIGGNTSLLVMRDEDDASPPRS